MDSGNGTMRVKPGNNRALRGLYNGWYDGNRNGGTLNKFQEEIECEELSAEFVRRLSWQLPEKCSPRLQELFSKFHYRGFNTLGYNHNKLLSKTL